MGEDMAAVAEKYELGMYFAEKEFEWVGLLSSMTKCSTQFGFEI